MKISKLLISLVVSGVACTPLEADVIDYSATLDSVSHYYFGGGSSGSHATWVYPSGANPTLSGTLKPGQQLHITYSAPPGKQINILTPPAFVDAIYTAADLSTDSGLSNPLEVPGLSYSFTGLVGAAPTMSSFHLGTDQSERLRASLVLAGAGYSFQSLKMVFDIPTSYDRTFQDFVPSDIGLFVGAAWSTNWSSDAFDPGPLATITSVPEPTTAALVMLGMGILARVRRRQGMAG